MRVIHEANELREACDRARADGLRVGLVPTMGALHAGHAALVERAARASSFVVVTIYVNPTQFGPNEDFSKYPRTLDADVALAEKAGAALVFAPSTEQLYLEGDETRVRVGRTAAALCGEFRPGHFEGVTTIVAKFFCLVGPCRAFFGRKDYQQLRVIERMRRDLFMPIEIVSVPTVREPDGLALSSRNRYLSTADRQRALAVPRSLSLAHAAFARGERRARVLEETCRAHLAAGVDSIDYATLADADSVVPFDPEATVGERAVLAVAVRVGGTRLIDNVVLGEDRAPISEVASS
ncbi:MAG: pantoate--beta-alanine ligase [Polyangiaceae bacterium]